jgi:hypothetical protein
MKTSSKGRAYSRPDSRRLGDFSNRRELIIDLFQLEISARLGHTFDLRVGSFARCQSGNMKGGYKNWW